jgi:hypothetical protein
MSVDIDETDGAKKKAAEPETLVEETAEEEESVVQPEPSESKRNYKNSKVVPVESS